MCPRSRVLAVTGPTAVGKSSLCLELADRLGAVLVSIDSRQIYRDLNIGTAKASPVDRGRVEHLLLDELDPSQNVSAGDYSARVLEATYSKIAKAPVIWLGGSTLYLHSLLFGIANIPEIDPEIRRRLNVEYKTKPQSLFEELQTVDPKYAASLDVTKSQRLVRGLEVYRATGESISSFHSKTKKPRYPFDISLCVLSRERSELHKRINARVDVMIEAGLIDEVSDILSRYPSDEILPGLNSIGYKEVVSYLKNDIDLIEMVRLIKRNSRRYAKRQETWFRKYEGISHQINLSKLSQEEALGKMIEHFNV